MRLFDALRLRHRPVPDGARHPGRSMGGWWRAIARRSSSTRPAHRRVEPVHNIAP
jgi:hypothetical protein